MWSTGSEIAADRNEFDLMYLARPHGAYRELSEPAVDDRSASS